MSKQSYRIDVTAASSGRKTTEPTLKDMLYSSIDELEDVLAQRPYFLDGLTRIMSTLVAHECRIIGF